MNKTDLPSVINMTVTNDDSFLSPYSPTETPVISAEVAEFLQTCAKPYKADSTLQLQIHSNSIDEKEKIVYSRAIRNYFNLQLEETAEELRRNTLVSLIFAVVGILGLAAMIVLDSFKVQSIWLECVDIFSWVFLWEAVDQMFIRRRQLQIKSKRMHAFVNMKVVYIPVRTSAKSV